MIGSVGGASIARPEVKFMDSRTTNYCASIHQRCIL